MENFFSRLYILFIKFFYTFFIKWFFLNNYKTQNYWIITKISWFSKTNIFKKQFQYFQSRSEVSRRWLVVVAYFEYSLCGVIVNVSWLWVFKWEWRNGRCFEWCFWNEIDIGCLPRNIENKYIEKVELEVLKSEIYRTFFSTTLELFFLILEPSSLIFKQIFQIYNTNK